MTKSRLKNTLLKALSVVIFCFGLLVIFLLNPVISYAHNMTYKQVTIYHHEQQLDARIFGYIDNSLRTIEASEIFDPSVHYSLCLNDGSVYPSVVETLLGSDVFTAFTDKVVVLGEVLKEKDRFTIWDEDLSVTQFASHGFMHNLQFNHHGLWDANPIGNYEQWKWEGYVDYIVLGRDRSLKEWISLLENSPQGMYEFVDLGNGKKTIRRHVEYLTLVKYVLEEKGYDYSELMAIETPEEELVKELSIWEISDSKGMN